MSKKVNDNSADKSGEQQQSRNLYVSVLTFDVENMQVGKRVVDMYHYGTRNWLQGHIWWAMHQGHTIEQNVATDEEVGKYLFEQEQALQAKYAKTTTPVAA